MATEKATSAKQPVWLITGCSTGFGHELAKQALARGFRVAATAREPDELKSLLSLGAALTFRLDVTDHRQIESAVKAAEGLTRERPAGSSKVGRTEAIKILLAEALAARAARSKPRQ